MRKLREDTQDTLNDLERREPEMKDEIGFVCDTPATGLVIALGSTYFPFKHLPTYGKLKTALGSWESPHEPIAILPLGSRPPWSPFLETTRARLGATS